MSEASSANPRRTSAFLTVLWIGLLAGTLDIADNLIFNQLRAVTPAMVFRYIASGLIGMDAVETSPESFTVALGVVLHYVIAVSWTAIFYGATRKFPILVRRPIICGLLYGGGVYLFMNLIVLPLSRVPHVHSAMTMASRINGVVALLLFIGLTVALLVRRYAPPA